MLGIVAVCMGGKVGIQRPTVIGDARSWSPLWLRTSPPQPTGWAHGATRDGGWEGPAGGGGSPHQPFLQPPGRGWLAGGPGAAPVGVVYRTNQDPHLLPTPAMGAGRRCGSAMGAGRRWGSLADCVKGQGRGKGGPPMAVARRTCDWGRRRARTSADSPG